MVKQVLEEASRRLALLCKIVACFIIFSLLGVTIVDVSSRYLYRLTDGVIAFQVSGSVELVSYLLLCSILAAMAANVERSQVIVEAFTHKLSDRIKTFLNGFYLLGFSALGFVLFFGLLESSESASYHGEVTQDLRIPMGPIYLTASIFSLVLGVRSFIHSVLSTIFGSKGEDFHG